MSDNPQSIIDRKFITGCGLAQIIIREHTGTEDIEDYDRDEMRLYEICKQFIGVAYENGVDDARSGRVKDE